MRYPNGSASATERTIACAASLVLPGVQRESEASARGTEIHSYIRAVLTGSPVATALAAIRDPATVALCAALDWRKIGGDLTGIATEQAYALDLKARTARFIGSNVGRNYEKDGPLGEHEVPGSLDLTGRRPDGVRVVVDVKTGFAEPTAAFENGQGLFFASVFYLLDGEEEVEFRIAHVRPSGKVWLDPATHTAFEIDGFLDEYSDALDRKNEARRVYLAGGKPPVHEGPWCTYCGGFDSCNAKQALVRSMLPDLVAVEGTLATATPEQLGEAWVLGHDRMKPLLERVLDLIKERARQERLPLPDGRELRESLSSSERLHAESLLALARKRGATEEEIAECYRESPVSRIIAAKPVGAAKAPRRPRALKPKEVA